MKVLILCGGKGTRLGNEPGYIPKAMVRIGHKPIVWHVMKKYSLAGFNNFILALGNKGELIRDFFTKYREYTNDIKIHLDSGELENLSKHQEDDWKITLIDTGEEALSGARIARCKSYLDDEDFMVTYSDCLADLNIDQLIKFHRKLGKVATITGAIPPYREGELLVKDNLAVGAYDAKKMQKNSSLRLFNGGFMVFKNEILSYLNSFNECKLEDVFLKLIKDKQLAVYPHRGFWRWLDAERDHLYLNDLVSKNKMYWLQR